MFESKVSENEKKEILEEFKKSNLAIASFARQKSIPESTFRGWLRNEREIDFGAINVQDSFVLPKPPSTILFNYPNIKIELTESAKEVIANEGYDPIYGARPLKRYISNFLETKIAKLIIKDEIYPDSTIIVDSKDDNIVIKVDDKVLN